MFKFRELRHRIDIERRSTKQDPVTGEVSKPWVAFLSNVPAKVAPLSVREFIASQAVQSGVTVRVTIRHRDGLTADMRIIHCGRVYNPQGWFADPDSGLEHLTAPCTEGVNEG
jgi:SPP1 family predicted phage head-tail adaptor